MPPLRVGKIVTFLHPTRAAKWPLARIVQVHPGRDGRVRVITLRTCGEGGGTYVRDVAKVAKLLPVEQREVAAPAAPLPTHQKGQRGGRENYILLAAAFTPIVQMPTAPRYERESNHSDKRRYHDSSAST